MRFAVLINYTDPAGRERALPAHREYLAKGREQGIVIESGPFADGKGGMYLLEVADSSAARAFVEADPYRTDGKLELIVREWNSVQGPKR
ncbi:MAG: hypothetical protein JO219_08630 [Candidatus Eremiobacteraeota bacterium]|nr:hypothetical protein [Candidatus Eremiobacteraeota bacterium]